MERATAIIVRMPAALIRKLVTVFGVVFVGGLVAAGTIPALAQSPEPAASGSPVALPGDPAKGQTAYNGTCTACHGANLEGGIGPKLNPLAKITGTPDYKKITDPGVADYLINVIANGKAPSDGFGAMPAKGGNTALSDQDVKDIAAYIIQTNLQGNAGLSPTDLARSNVFWVTVGVGVMVLLTYLLARYNMRWIALRARKRSE
jgi:mono/diheme cytochrome c family protein